MLSVFSSISFLLYFLTLSLILLCEDIKVFRILLKSSILFNITDSQILIVFESSLVILNEK